MTRNYLEDADNTSSVAINIPGGLILGTDNQTLVHVSKISLRISVGNFIVPHWFPQINSHGYFSFGRNAELYNPVLFPESQTYNFLVAPYWVDFDMHQTTQISYEIHDSFTGLLSLVNNFIQQEDDEEFVGTWMMIVSFEAPENGFKVFFARGSHDYQEVGIFASLQTNSVQGIIITNGNQSYALFTYKCGTLSSTGIRTNGTIGFNSDGNYFRNFPLSGTSRVNEVACLNLPNTLWSNLLYSLTPTSGMLT